MCYHDGSGSERSGSVAIARGRGRGFRIEVDLGIHFHFHVAIGRCPYSVVAGHRGGGMGSEGEEVRKGAGVGFREMSRSGAI